MRLRVTKSFADHLQDFTGKYASISDRAIEKLEEFIEDPDNVPASKFKKLIDLEAYSFRVLGNNAPGGPRVVMARGQHDEYVPMFVGNHRDYDSYLAGGNIELEIFDAQTGQGIVMIETDEFKHNAPVDPLKAALPEDVEIGEYVSPSEGRTVNFNDSGVSMTEAQIAVFDKLDMRMDYSEIRTDSVREALGDLKTAKELMLNSPAKDRKSGAELFQTTYYMMDYPTVQSVHALLDVGRSTFDDPAAQGGPNSEVFTYIASGVDAVENAENSHFILLMSEFQRRAPVEDGAELVDAHVAAAVGAEAELDSYEM